jgi:hypothetical protein
MLENREGGLIMAVTSRDIRSESRGRAPALPRSVGALAYILTALLAAAAIYVLVGSIVSWGQVRIDDVRYGRPRTTHIEGYVGHGGEVAGRPTKFVGLNLDRQVVVIEIPAGDVSQLRTIMGPYLFGAREDLTPVLLYLHDMDRDGLTDLVVNVRDEQIIYLNRDGAFRLPTADEQHQLVQEHGS